MSNKFFYERNRMSDETFLRKLGNIVSACQGDYIQFKNAWEDFFKGYPTENQQKVLQSIIKGSTTYSGYLEKIDGLHQISETPTESIFNSQFYKNPSLDSKYQDFLAIVEETKAQKLSSR